MLPTRYQVIFEENPRGVFFSGQKLTGTLIIETFVPKRIRGVFIRIIGRGRVEFLPKNGRIRGENFALFNKQVMLETRFDNSLFDFDVGLHRYPFRVDIPIELPSSFYGKYGYIHYEIYVKLKADRESDSFFKQPFILVHVNSEFKDKILPPIKRETVKEICYCCCLINSLLKIHVIAPSRSFSPGETLFVCIKLDNDTNERITTIKVKLFQTIEYCMPQKRSETRVERNSVVKAVLNDDKDLSGKILVKGLKIPLTQPSTERFKIIHIEYILLIYVKLPTCCEDDVDIMIPISIDAGKEVIRKVLSCLQARAAAKVKLLPIQHLMTINNRPSVNISKTQHSMTPSLEPVDIGFKVQVQPLENKSFEVFDPLKEVKKMCIMFPTSSLSHASCGADTLNSGREPPPPIGHNIPSISNSLCGSVSSTPTSSSQTNVTPEESVTVVNGYTEGSSRQNTSTEDNPEHVESVSNGSDVNIPKLSFLLRRQNACDESTVSHDSCIPNFRRRRCSLPTTHSNEFRHFKSTGIVHSSKGAYGFISQEENEQDKRN